MAFQRILGELKQRNVLRVAGVYAVTAWAVFQVVNPVFQTFQLPPWATQLVLLLLALGFPFAVIVAWALERGPDGRVRRATAADAEAEKPKVAWADWALAAGLASVVVLIVLQASGVLGAGAIRSGGSVGAAAKSVAVLPFANFSSHPEGEYFADGLTEEVIHSLAQVPDLQVAGRTSAFYFKGKNEDLREIGRKLGVAHVVEGSVRRDNDRLRVTAQLIEVKGGFHLWSKTYDRPSRDAFTIQTEIAESVAESLKSRLHISEARKPVQRDPEAQRLELVARAKVRGLGLKELTDARAMYRRLIELEPRNAEAHAGYANATALLAQNHLALDFNTAIREAEGAIRTALSIDPRSAEAYVADGIVCHILIVRTDRQSCVTRAAASFRKAVELAPRNPDALTMYGDHLASVRPAEAVTYLQRALDVDPLNRVARNALASAYGATGRLADAEREYQANIELYPDFVDAKQELGGLLESYGELARAEPWLRAAAAPGTDPSAAIELAHLYYNLGLPEDAAATLRTITEPPIAVGVADAIRLITAGNYKGLLTFSRSKLAEDGDPFWRSAIVTAAMLADEPEAAREQVVALWPELLRPEPVVEGEIDSDAVNAAFVVGATGDQAQARRLAAAVLAATEPTGEGVRRNNQQLVARAKAYAMLGDRDRAIAELEQAAANGWRLWLDLDAFLPLDRYPQVAALRADPRFAELRRRVLEDNARMRAALLQRRPAPNAA